MECSGHIERRAQVLQCAKNEMACKIAELNECTLIRADLERRLFDLNTNIKQLKARQYQLHQLNINAQCERLQYSKAQQQCQEEIQLSRAVAQQIQIDIAEQMRKNVEEKQRIEQALKRKNELEAKIDQKNSIIAMEKANIKQMQLKDTSLKKMECNRIEILKKIEQSHQYYAKKAEQIKIAKKTLQKHKQAEDNQAIELKQAIDRQQKQLQDLISQKTQIERHIINENQKMSSEQLKNKVLVQKLEIMRQHLTEIQEQQLYTKQLLESKKNTARQMEEKRSTKRSAWLAMRNRISVELEYASYYCQKLGY